MPISKDKICFVATAYNWDTAKQKCINSGFDGLAEFRHEEDTLFVAKLLYCASIVNDPNGGSYYKPGN